MRAMKKRNESKKKKEPHPFCPLLYLSARKKKEKKGVITMISDFETGRFSFFSRRK